MRSRTILSVLCIAALFAVPAFAQSTQGMQNLFRAHLPGAFDWYLLAAIQRPFAGEAPGTGATHTRIGRYDLLLEQWDFYTYPYAKVTSAANIGLSEITPFGRTASGEELFAVMEDMGTDPTTAEGKVCCAMLDRGDFASAQFASR